VDRWRRRVADIALVVLLAVGAQGRRIAIPASRAGLPRSGGAGDAAMRRTALYKA
jgi:hypothetical protein